MGLKSFPVLLMVAVAFAGCMDAGEDTGDDGGPVDPSPTPTDDAGDGGAAYDFDAGIAVPQWKVGDWWSYKVDYASGESFDAKIVVYDEDGGAYHITSDMRGLVVRASFNHYPNFGPVAKSDLSQEIHGTQVSDFRFPMKNGTWSGTYRDYEATWETTVTTLETGQGPVPGFSTVMRNAADGLPRITHGWSPVTRWYTEHTFDFDGTDPVDVTVTLQDWGRGHNGTLPLVTVIDGVHRPFPAHALGAPDPEDPPDTAQPEATDTMTLEEEGASILWGMFAGAGGPGDFEFDLLHADTGTHHAFPWRPTAAASTFAWNELTDQPTGEWQVSGIGTAQGFAFLFLEVYEVRTGEVDVVPAP